MFAYYLDLALRSLKRHKALTGLMILTNDGELANKLAHPRYGVEKVYRALVAGRPTREVTDKLVEGVWLAEGKARAKRVRIVGHKGEATVLELVLAEGKNREVRRMLAKLGHKVMTLTRVAVGPITLRGLKVGTSRHLTPREVDLLRRVASGQHVPTPSFGVEREPRPRSLRGARRAAGPAAATGQGPARPTGPPKRTGVKPRQPRRPAAAGLDFPPRALISCVRYWGLV